MEGRGCEASSYVPQRMDFDSKCNLTVFIPRTSIDWLPAEHFQYLWLVHHFGG